MEATIRKENYSSSLCTTILSPQYRVFSNFRSNDHAREISLSFEQK